MLVDRDGARAPDKAALPSKGTPSVYPQSDVVSGGKEHWLIKSLQRRESLLLAARRVS
jgi:hypothetical protein